MTDRDQARHARQHELIAERREVWQLTPKRGGVNRIRRREAGKKYVWTLRGHLLQFHQRGIDSLLTVEQLERLHETYSHE